MKNPTKLTTRILNRLALFASVVGMIGVTYGETQNEKGDAGDGPGIAEGFDCKKDKWICTHFDPLDSDLLCFYWSGGPFTCKGKGFDAGWWCGIMLFNQTGVCIATDEPGAAMTEASVSFADLPPGFYYVYCGWHVCYGYEDKAKYDLGGMGNSYCYPGVAGTPASPTGSLYKVKQGGGATGGHRYECCVVGYTNNPGIPFQQAAKAGEKSGKTKGGKTTQIMSTQKKAKFFCSCDNPTTTRGATGVQFRGVSKRKFKQKYVDIATGENMTAEVIGTEFCKNYDPGFKQIFKCTMKPKGRFKKMDNVKSKCIIDCLHDGGVNADSQKVNFYANMDKKKKS